MWRNVCAVVLLASVVDAQMAAQVESQPAKTPTSKSTAPKAQACLYYSELRRGTKEKAVVNLVVLPGTEGTRIVLTKADNGKFIPAKLELQGSDGISLTPVRYPKSRPQDFHLGTTLVPTFNPYVADLYFDLNAAKDAPLGPHILLGKLTLQTVSTKGLSAPQSLDIQIPVTIVEHNARVSKTGGPFLETPTWQVVLVVVLWAAAFPLFIVYSIGCHIAGNCTD